MWQGTKILQQRSHGAAYARVQYDTSHTVDFTNGQLSKVPFYKITISSVGIRDHLMKFDPRFSVLMKIPIKIDSNMTPPAQRQLSKPAKRKRQTSQSSTSAVSQEHSGLQNDLESYQKYQRVVQTKDSLKTCACTSGCMSKRCNCIKEGRKCESDCRCFACNNPLNILAEFGVNLAEARRDICFMQNLSKISNLRAFLRDSVETPCCEGRIPLSNCCIGIVECPECESEYRYSWCSHDLCDEENRPRNHCAICQTCRDYRDQHCRRCNRCYFAGSSGFSCPCRGGSRRAMSMFGFMF